MLPSHHFVSRKICFLFSEQEWRWFRFRYSSIRYLVSPDTSIATRWGRAGEATGSNYHMSFSTYQLSPTYCAHTQRDHGGGLDTHRSGGSEGDWGQGSRASGARAANPRLAPVIDAWARSATCDDAVVKAEPEAQQITRRGGESGVLGVETGPTRVTSIIRYSLRGCWVILLFFVLASVVTRNRYRQRRPSVLSSSTALGWNQWDAGGGG